MVSRGKSHHAFAPFFRAQRKKEVGGAPYLERAASLKILAF
jgi:hypothetical protein